MWPLNTRWQSDLKPVRQASNKFIELVEEGFISPIEAVRMCVKWMSEDDVAEMMKANELDMEDEEDAV